MSKYFRETLGIRDNESRLYSVIENKTHLSVILFQTESADDENRQSGTTISQRRRLRRTYVAITISPLFSPKSLA